MVGATTTGAVTTMSIHALLETGIGAESVTLTPTRTVVAATELAGANLITEPMRLTQGGTLPSREIFNGSTKATPTEDVTFDLKSIVNPLPPATTGTVAVNNEGSGEGGTAGDGTGTSTRPAFVKIATRLRAALTSIVTFAPSVDTTCATAPTGGVATNSYTATSDVDPLAT
jgi:hypothetical protein